MKTLRQLLCVRSLVLATALATFLLLCSLTTPAGAQTGPYHILVKDMIVSLAPGTDIHGNPAVIATMHGSFWTTFPVGATTKIRVDLDVDDKESVLNVWLPVTSRNPLMPDILTVSWSYRVPSGTHNIAFNGVSTVGGTAFGTDNARWHLELTMTEP